MEDNNAPFPQSQVQSTMQDSLSPLSSNPKKISAYIIFVIFSGLLILCIGGFGGYYLATRQLKPSDTKECTMEAKLCPDGSSVGRSGPNCEFTPCPTAAAKQDEVVTTYLNNLGNFEFQYTSNFVLSESELGGNLQTPSNNRISFYYTRDNSTSISAYVTKADAISKTSYEGQPSLEVQSTTEVVHNGLRCIERNEYIIAADITQVNTYCKNNDIVVSFAFIPTPGNIFIDDKINYYIILDSFRFIQQPTTILKCTSDKDCPQNTFCDYSRPGGMGPNGTVSGKPYGSQQCIVTCQKNDDCPTAECQKYETVGGDIATSRMGCKLQ